MSKTMTKYQLDHFRDKVKRQFNPMIEEAELLVKQFKTELRDWASTLAEREIERRPEGAKLKQLKDLKTKALDVVMESGTPDTLAIALDNVSKKIGLRWNQDLQALPNFKQ